MQAILPPTSNGERRATDGHAPTRCSTGVFDGRYLIRRKLGSGGMADVYLAEDQELGRPVALKMLNERHAADEQFVERFRREAQNAAGLNHPNIVSIFDRGQAEGTYYIAMEFLDGRTLKELLVRNGPTPIPIAIDYARQILQRARVRAPARDRPPRHQAAQHRRRRATAALKVTDFGIARSGASQMTEAGSIVGTAQYLSPEQARGAPVDPRSDLYSLGIVLYEMLTGTVPFTGDAPVEIAMKHLHDRCRSRRRRSARRCRTTLDAVVMRALAKDPGRPVRLGRGDGRRPGARRPRRRGLAADRGGDDAGARGAAPAAATMVAPAARTTPPAPPAYRPPAPYYGTEPPRRRSPWPWLLGLLALAIAGGDRLPALRQDPGPAQREQAGRRSSTSASCRSPLAKQKLEAAGLPVVVIKSEPNGDRPASAP